jgi:hypothetical protein
MKLRPQPRLLAPRVGQTWLRSGFQLFHRQPLAWTLILFIYWASMLMLAFIPLFGAIVPLLLSPGLALGFIEVARAIDEKRPPSPPLLIGAFRSDRVKPIVILGGWYAAIILAILLIGAIFDGGVLVQWITAGVQPQPDEVQGMRTAAIIGILLYIPVIMAFWFAPQLVMWSGFAPTKALFFSFFAVLRNKGAFLRYLLTWIGLTVFVGAVLALVGQIMGSEPGTMTAFMFPITLILMAVAHGSFYQSTKDVFGEDERAATTSATTFTSTATPE